jgi:nanoRNase/pAp phosphatase (c-di-AMP/oligoRNAs hydrolase)
MNHLTIDLTNPIGPAQLDRLRGIAGKGPVLILTHDNPDPDALASAWALHAILARGRRRKVDVAYGGLIGRPANRAMVSILRFPLVSIDRLELSRYDRFALVDSQPETGNNSLPAERVPDVVIDHHPLREETRGARYFDVRPRYGATATLLTEYLEAARARIDRRLATALFFALKSETLDLARQTSARDLALYTRLFQIVDRQALLRIEQAPFSRNYLDWLQTAIGATEIDGVVALANLGALDYPDRVAEFADIAIRLEGLEWALVVGRFEGALHLSVRTTRGVGAGRVIRKIVGTLGKAGGHGTMAGGKVPIAAGRSAEDLEREILARAREILGS